MSRGEPRLGQGRRRRAGGRARRGGGGVLRRRRGGRGRGGSVAARRHAAAAAQVPSSRDDARWPATRRGYTLPLHKCDGVRRSQPLWPSLLSAARAAADSAHSLLREAVEKHALGSGELQACLLPFLPPFSPPRTSLHRLCRYLLSPHCLRPHLPLHLLLLYDPVLLRLLRCRAPMSRCCSSWLRSSL